MSGRFLILANPIAGGGRARALAPALAATLRQRGCTAEVFLTTGAGCASARAARAGDEPWDALVAIGGDGTVNEVLNGMPDPSRPLGVLPVGTANVLAREYRLPTTVDGAAAALAAGRTAAHAIGIANGRRFLLFCGIGIDGAVVRRLHDIRIGTLGKHKWIGPILHVVRRWPRFSLRVTLPDGEVLDQLSSVLVTRVRNYGGVVRLLPDVDPGDGLLHVLCFRQRGRLAWIALGAKAAMRRLRATGGLSSRTATALRVDGDAPFHVDGDFAGVGPVVLSLADAPAQLLVP